MMNSYIVYEEKSTMCIVLERCKTLHDARLMWSFFAGTRIPRIVYIGDGEPRRINGFPGLSYTLLRD